VLRPPSERNIVAAAPAIVGVGVLGSASGAHGRAIQRWDCADGRKAPACQRLFREMGTTVRPALLYQRRMRRRWSARRVFGVRSAVRLSLRVPWALVEGEARVPRLHMMTKWCLQRRATAWILRALRAGNYDEMGKFRVGITRPGCLLFLVFSSPSDLAGGQVITSCRPRYERRTVVSQTNA